jgi:signal transduction histidine kinase
MDDNLRLKALRLGLNGLNQSDNEDQIISIALDCAAKAELNNLFIGILEDEAIVIKYRLKKSTTPDDNKVRISRNERGVISRVLREMNSQVVDDTRLNQENPSPLIAIDEEVLAELAVPIIVQGTLFGVIYTTSPTPAAFTINDIQFVEVLALSISLALDNLKLRRTESRCLDMLKALSHHTAKLMKAKNRAEIFETSVSMLHNALGYEWTGVAVLMDGLPKYVSSAGTYPTFAVPSSNGFENDPNVTLQPSSLSTSSKILKELVAPVIVDSRTEALLSVKSERKNVFPSEDQMLAETLAIQIGCYLEILLEKNLLSTSNDIQTKEIMTSANRISNLIRHDLRVPLQTIKSAAYLLEKRPEKAADMRVVIDNSIDYATRIINELDLAGPMELKRETIDLKNLIGQSIESIQIPQMIEIRKDLGAGINNVFIDSVKMRRAIVNLIKNAIEAMPNGGMLTLTAVKADNEYMISVTDTGLGITPDVKKNLFKPFYTTKRWGTGLGLTICKQVAEAHGGTISVESEVGKGSTFTMKIPVQTTK